MNRKRLEKTKSALKKQDKRATRAILKNEMTQEPNRDNHQKQAKTGVNTKLN